MPNMKECLKPHALVHSLTGIGIGLLLAGWIPALSGSAVTWGIILVVIGVAAEFVVNK